MSQQHPGIASRSAEKQAVEQNTHSEDAREREDNNPDRIDPVPNIPNPSGNPFATPNTQTPSSSSPFPSNPGSRAPSRTDTGTSTSSSGLILPGGQRYFRSRRIKKGEIEKPWLEKKDPREKWVTIIPVIGIIIGLAVSGVLIWDGLRSVVNHKYCPVLLEDFSKGWNEEIWTKEVEVGGYGNGQFEMTTDTDENVFIDKGVLVIKPTRQHQDLIQNDNVLDLRGHGCTGSRWTDCIATTNTTNGTIVNPVKSGRVNTKLGASIKYGRVEVTAKLPAGDWLWPAIWMLPKDNVYGVWPKSGEIDIMESRGNNYTYEQGGNNIVSSTLHFGPNSKNDGWWRNNVKRRALHTTYAANYHIYGVEWSEKYIFTYIDTRLLQVMYTRFEEPFWSYGQFPLSDSNGTSLENPWAHSDNVASPFDQDFYLVLNVAVGGTNGWFKDGKSGKPWLDSSPTAPIEFYRSMAQWYPTWEQQGWMEVKSVKMWQQAGYNGCAL